MPCAVGVPPPLTRFTPLPRRPSFVIRNPPFLFLFPTTLQTAAPRPPGGARRQPVSRLHVHLAPSPLRRRLLPVAHPTLPPASWAQPPLQGSISKSGLVEAGRGSNPRQPHPAAQDGGRCPAAADGCVPLRGSEAPWPPPPQPPPCNEGSATADVRRWLSPLGVRDATGDVASTTSPRTPTRRRVLSLLLPAEVYPSDFAAPYTFTGLAPPWHLCLSPRGCVAQWLYHRCLSSLLGIAQHGV